MRKQKKRLIACILVLTLAGGQFVPASAAGTEGTSIEEQAAGIVAGTDEKSNMEDAGAPDNVQGDTENSEEKDPENDVGEATADETDGATGINEADNVDMEDGSEIDVFPDGEAQKETDETSPDMDTEVRTEETAEKQQELLTQSLEESIAGISYQISGQSSMEKPVMDGAVAGQPGSGKRIEGISIKLYTEEEEEKPAGGIRYRTHVQNVGWMDWVSDGAYAGTKGQSLRMEAVQIELTGEIKEKYDVYYTTYVQKIGWLGWAKNGQSSGQKHFRVRLKPFGSA